LAIWDLESQASLRDAFNRTTPFPALKARAKFSGSLRDLSKATIRVNAKFLQATTTPRQRRLNLGRPFKAGTSGRREARRGATVESIPQYPQFAIFSAMKG
jgi:hypothetical protein